MNLQSYELGPEQAPDNEKIMRDGFALLRSVISTAELLRLRDAFEAGVKSSDQWPVPRGSDWRHALVDLDPAVQALCREARILTVAGKLIGERFFLSQVEGREPLAGGGQQALHRDLSAKRPGDTAVALAFLDDFSAENGATRLVPGSHKGTGNAWSTDASHVLQLSGSAGDVVVLDADLLHAASCNRSGERRRALLINYFAEPLYASHRQTLALRNIRMDTSQMFAP